MKKDNLMCNKVIEKIILSVGLFFMASHISAQTFIWSMPPRDYSEINRITKGLYQFVENGKIGVVKPDGTIVVDAVCTEITPFYENQALLMSSENGKDKVIGTLSTSGDYCLFSKTYYPLSGQLFYSDGLLSVENEKGEKGYIDEKGYEVVGFNDHYTTIKPFSEGYASVFQNKEYALIDKSGERQSMIIGIGKVRNGTNVYNGEAIIWDTEGNFYSFNAKTKKCKSVSKPKNTQIDYLYCFSELSKRDRTIPYSQMSSGEIGISPTQINGKYGFLKDDKVLLPIQFESATLIEDRYTVVGTNGKCGILKYIESSDTFTISVHKSDVVYNSGKNAECSFSILTPDIYKERGVDVVVKEDMSSSPQDINCQGEIYTFKTNPKSSKQSYIVDIISDGMILASDTISYTFKKKTQGLQMVISIKNTEADDNDKIWVYAEIKNPNDEVIKITVTMMGGDAEFEKITESITIDAKSVKTIKSYFSNIKSEHNNQYVRVSTSNGNTVTKNKITLKPRKVEILNL